MQITWPWPPVGRFSHDLIILRQKEAVFVSRFSSEILFYTYLHTIYIKFI